MKYMGSKAKIAEYIVPIIQSHIAISGSRTYIEPFYGGCNVIDKVKAEIRIGADKNQYLIALFKHLQDGNDLPFEITKEEYDRVRDNIADFPPWYVGAVGFLVSFNGRFFDGGYAGIRQEGKTARNYYQESKKNILNQLKRGGITSIDFIAKDYREFNPKGCVIYCDPPYDDTKDYITTKDFSPRNFGKQ